MKRTLSTLLTVGAATTLITVGATAPASAQNGYHWLALRTPTNVKSVYVTGQAQVRWRVGTTNETGGFTGSVTACYMYVSDRNNGDWAKAGEQLRVYVNEAPGRQGLGSGDQFATVNFQDGKNLSLLTLSSRDCTTGALKNSSATVPGDNLQFFWKELR